MAKHGISEDTVRKQITLCTDRGSNMLSAFAEFTRIDDVCHQMSILSKRIVDPYKNNWLPEQFRLDDDVKESLKGLTKLLKDSTKVIKGINSRPKLRKQLSEGGIFLAAHHEIRWLSRYRSIKSLLKLLEEDNENLKEAVFDVLAEYRFNGQYVYREAVDNINAHVEDLRNYVEFIKPIKDAVKILESETEPTINQILVQYHNIENHFREALGDENEVIKNMAKSGIAALSYHKTISSSFSDIHTLGLMLDPLQKDKLLAITGRDNILEAINMFKRYVRKYDNRPAPQEEHVDDPMIDSPFAEFTTSNIDLLDVEIESYLKK
uniref:Uncharacterized protein n=1 Tax=Panagrolaimus davidi TaxID=227884 RepID=A0A914PIC3_9BILA